MKSSRGAVLAETALFVSAALLFMLGTIQIGVIGFLQLTADSASYLDARENVLTLANGMTPEQYTNQTFPQIPIPNISATILPAPTPSIPVDYGWNDPSPSVQADSAYNRHGGASMLQPEAMQVTVNVPHLVNVLGQGLGVQISSTESYWTECGTHFDIANVGCSLPSPPANSQNNYFSLGENTPPYLVGFNYMQQCTLAPPWGYYTGSDATAAKHPGSNGLYLGGSFNNSSSPNAAWNSSSPCASSAANTGSESFGYIALGTAEFLNAANWSNTGASGSSGAGAGISGPCDPAASAANSSYGQEATDQTVFCAIWWHQHVYADLAVYFAQYPYQNTPEYYSQMYANSTGTTSGTWTYNQGNQFGAYSYANGNVAMKKNPSVGTGYNAFGGTGAPQGNGTDATNVAIPENVLTFESWEGFDDPDYGPGYYASGAPVATPDRWNADVQTIYSWDIPVSAGDPPSDPTYNNPTHPLNGS